MEMSLRIYLQNPFMDLKSNRAEMKQPPVNPEHIFESAVKNADAEERGFFDCANRKIEGLMWQ